MKVDAHVHVWDPTFPTHHDHPLPSISASVQDLISNMDAAAINKTLVVQPINYMFDHSCVTAAVKAYPSRLFGIGLANTAASPQEACNQLEHLVQTGFRGVRINPNFTNDTFQNESVLAVGRRAGELDVPVMLFARPKHLPDVEHFIKSCADTTIILDHFAFATPHDQATQQKVNQLAQRFPNLFLKTSAWFRVSQKQWPHDDLQPFLDSLLSSFGPERLLFGSDYPFVKQQYDYSKACSLPQTRLDDSERAWIEGDSAARIFKL